MSDQDTTTRAQFALARIKQTAGKFDKFNQTLPKGMDPINPNWPALESTSALDALISMLTASGVVDEQEFVDRKYEQLADMADKVWDSAKDQKRQALGLQIHQNVPTDLKR